ncbi:lipocalin family protein [bacterium]|nr:lipocalin family protein [bacterium]
MKLVASILVCLTTFVLTQTSVQTEPEVVEFVNLDQYKGLWYEIAKIPNRFQKKCAGNTTAEYILRKDGRIDVVNRCMRKDGEIITAKGVAKIADMTTCAKLKVSFVSLLGIRLFWGDYWIIGLDDNYQWAIVGSPDREYGWILSRTPQLPQETIALINGILVKQGYDPEAFVITRHEPDLF